MNTSQSKSLFQEASRYIPGGVNSPVRAFKSVGGDPIFMDHAKGAYLYDADGNRYIDYIASWGPMIMGHAWAPVIEAVQKAAERSTSFGAPTEMEIELARLIVESIPNVERIRMVNSGTEATMSAIRLARGFTGKNKFIKFAGNYHGHGDSFLIKAGSGAVTLGHPSSPGVTPGTAQDTLLAEYNDLEGVKALVQANPNEIAAIILEPIPGNMGCILPEAGFIEGLRELCTQENILLIFDEVMTGFRLGFGGAQEALGIEADLVTYGKVIGAGLPVGAYGGREDIMEYVAPNGPVYQAGTLSGNPIAMTAGYTLLKYLKEHPEVYQDLETKCARIEEGLHPLLKAKGLPYQINRKGSMISLHFSDQAIRDFESAKSGDNDYFKKFFHGMLQNGVYLPPSAYESWFLNAALSNQDIEQTLEATQKSLELL
ncbi:glutamate-1-semialdehyde 2,1-aminomutase [Croceimicrobium sp.]|uniref:glutamate-1-semialdehyde 2,1-aminomutase n=1 Tax=Croceimicrobium sp. TaxID=2828340 RepID=UPI003BAADB31